MRAHPLRVVARSGVQTPSGGKNFVAGGLLSPEWLSQPPFSVLFGTEVQNKYTSPNCEIGGSRGSTKDECESVFQSSVKFISNIEYKTSMAIFEDPAGEKLFITGVSRP